jgi:GxxExxY protein
VEIDEITGEIVDAAVKLHKRFGPGMLESVYERLLAHELTRRGLTVERQRAVTFSFEGATFENAFRVDLLVNDIVAVEVKSLETLAPVHHKQLLTYLRPLDLRVGLLINFGAAMLRGSIHRVVNGYAQQSPRLRVNPPRDAMLSPRQ